MHSRTSSAGWASARLQAQLQLQRAQLAAAAGADESVLSVGGSGGGGGSAAAPVVGAAGSEDASFASQVRWSQGSSQEDAGREGAEEGGWDQGEDADGDEGQTRTPKRQFRVEVEEERLTSSALRGGAASGLLSLANARR